MVRTIVFYREVGGKFVYRAGQLSQINNRNLKGFVARLKSRGCKILFAQKIEGEQAILSRIDHRAYNVALCYSTGTNRLARQAALPADIKPFRFRNAAGCRRDLGKKVSEFFSEWKSYLGPRYLEGARVGMKMLKDPGKYLCLKKGRKTVALVYMMDWMDWRGRPVDWVGHIWIDAGLDPFDRGRIHGYIAAWWKRTAKTGKIQGVVNSFNLRSQKFFRKMGFKPECLHVLKAK